MERDLDVKPGMKIAGCVILVIAAIGFLWYPIGYSLHSLTAPLARVGPIDFYGRVVDEQGVGIPGVTLSAKIRSYRIIGGYVERVADYETDPKGEFRIQARRGLSVRVSEFSKSGFSIRGRPPLKGQGVESIDHWLFYFNPTGQDLTITDPQNPSTFIMERTIGPNKSASSSPNPLRVD